uniref:PPM-type phosphatase domain-containing protein n=1 Tax=Lactuca sativa TaxID=4236 RepID=A0A9R1XUJ6_LACSA|nr:hypothetical protein LSAT_V11C100049660 [Lactuca sativa]
MLARWLSSAGGRLVISSDGVWDALSTESALECSHGLAPKSAAAQIESTLECSRGLAPENYQSTKTIKLVYGELRVELRSQPIVEMSLSGQELRYSRFRGKAKKYRDSGFRVGVRPRRVAYGCDLFTKVFE